MRSFLNAPIYHLPSDFKIIAFKKIILWEIVARKPDFAARTRTICTDSHPLYNKYQNLVCLVKLILFKKASYRMQCCPVKALDLR